MLVQLMPNGTRAEQSSLHMSHHHVVSYVHIEMKCKYVVCLSEDSLRQRHLYKAVVEPGHLV